MEVCHELGVEKAVEYFDVKSHEMTNWVCSSIFLKIFFLRKASSIK